MRTFTSTDPGLLGAFWEVLCGCPTGCHREGLEVREDRDGMSTHFRIRCRGCGEEGPARSGPDAARGAWNAMAAGRPAEPPPAFEPWWTGEEARP